MSTLTLRCSLLVLLIPFQSASADEKPPPPKAKDVLRVFNDLIGSWKASGTPEGTRDEQRRGFWTETFSWTWKFKGDDAWLEVTFDKGKHFRDGELRYLPHKDIFQFRVQTTDKQALSFEGQRKENSLVLERTDDAKQEKQRLVFTLLHGTRCLYRFEVKPKERAYYTRRYQVGATKEGAAFADSGTAGPECVVSGGLGTITVSYKGQTYYVCCTGCREAFKDNPEKYLKEYQERKAKEAKEKRP